MEGYAVVMGPKLFIVSPGVPAGNDEGGCRLSFVFYAAMERSGKRQKTSDLERRKMASEARGRIFNLATHRRFSPQPYINLEGRHPVAF
ncbi:hypothetical protein OUZ56_017052 [Daphnia magna]|uniref:Uncharacterized protein n=1 Tax=Daphnia magna TaxID=35525 RepID=A0ABR0AS34_9CRUS|nr:hypothetical protein OUZ56_017052 [Daphnia magna]